MSLEKKDIKETKEAIAALQLASVTVKHIVKGGISAVPGEIIALAPKYNVFIEGYKDSGKIKEELMDLDKQEIIDLFVTVFDDVKEFEKA
jgi:hypothetical protein